mgnify:CR=1 FL=1
MCKFIRPAQAALLSLLALNFALAACAQTSAATPMPTAKPTGTPTQLPALQPTSTSTPVDRPPAVLAAIRALSSSSGVPENQVTVVRFDAAQWPDACLGLAQPGEMCAQVITPGFRVVLQAKGQQFEFHTNADGTVTRQK